MGHLTIPWDIRVLGEAPCVWLNGGRITDHESREAITDFKGFDRAPQREDMGLEIGKPTLQCQ